MNATKKRIILAAIDNFNKDGVGNVRVHDIAKAIDISPGNLTYHFKTKSDLMFAVYEYMMKELKDAMLGKELFEDLEEAIFIISDYLKFQLQYRFFYRDVLDISRLCPDLKASYAGLISEVHKFNGAILQLSIANEYIIPEENEGHYVVLIKNHWAILHGWLTQREVFGDKAASVNEGIKTVLCLYFPYLTTKGKEVYFKMMRGLSIKK